uniref:Uncharacterized protein n=1 Tax=Rhizophora mucronata TaxID=61149 RepID=A0A2P2QFX6_RHIMU
MDNPYVFGVAVAAFSANGGGASWA